jgi:predicted DNA-binding transcriptional regulator AlpA
MKRRGVTGKLATVRDLAALTGLSRARAYTISQHWSFPTPLDVLGDDSARPMAVWWRKDVERWVAENPEVGKR